MSLNKALEEARRRLLPLKGVVAVSARGGRIVVYVVSEEEALKIPRMFMGIPVETVVVGRIERL